MGDTHPQTHPLGLGDTPFDAPREAEAGDAGDAPPPPAGGGRAAAEDAPTVLSKLLKWGDYEAVGAPVAPSRFIPCKTPMSAEILASWSLPSPPRHSLTVRSLLARAAAAGTPVGLIIDLANHACLYSEDLAALPPGERPEYVHVRLVAKVLPPRAAVDAVAAAADEFWARRPREYVAIHCAYGFNRTGFVVAAVLCQARGMPVADALAAFAAARPPGVKHRRFLAELEARYGGGGGGGGGDAEPGGACGGPAGCGGRDGGAPEAPPGELARALSAAAEAAASPASSRSASPTSTAGPASPAAAAAAAAADSMSTGGGTSGGGGAPPVLAFGHDPGSDVSLGPGRGAGSGSPPRGATDAAAAYFAEALSLEGGAAAGRAEMRRTTSLGLARALAEDFGQHEGTPGTGTTPAGGTPAVSPRPSPVRTGVGVSSGGGPPPEEEGLYPFGSPIVGARLPPPPGQGWGAPPAFAAAAVAAAAAHGRAALGAPASRSGMLRTLSAESDNKSLGFGHHEAMLHLLGAAGGGGDLAGLGALAPGGGAAAIGAAAVAATADIPRSETHEALHELDEALWCHDRPGGGGSSARLPRSPSE